MLLDQRPNYREENEEHGYVDEFSIPAEDLEQVWQILSIMQEKPTLAPLPKWSIKRV